MGGGSKIYHNKNRGHDGAGVELLRRQNEGIWHGMGLLNAIG